MVWIEAAGEGFWMDETEVTTAEFAAFVEETGYVTEAEEFGWSGVFDRGELAWIPVTGADFRHPRGPEEPAARPDHPVTQVSLRDARAYAEWAGKELPSEEQWMTAATQTHDYLSFPWGEEMLPGGKYLGNWWQGPFPYRDEVADGYAGIAPVGQFPPAENGLFDISGNVWEWTSTTKSATGESVIKGGSFLCSTSYCTGFDLQQRQFTPSDSGLNHLGFRCIARP
jgi:sulfatase modifying factor 1